MMSRSRILINEEQLAVALGTPVGEKADGLASVINEVFCPKDVLLHVHDNTLLNATEFRYEVWTQMQ
eukprot:2559385-Amphidinium_carterae.1